MNRDNMLILGVLTIILLIVFLILSFKTKKALFYTLSVFTFFSCVGVGIIYYSLPLNSDALNVDRKNNGISIYWKGDFWQNVGIIIY